MAVTDRFGSTPLSVAAEHGYLEIVMLLLEKGADVTVRNKDGWTLLNLAVNRGHIEVIELLLKEGADMTVIDN
jgi:ankyrin repeat protein